MLDESAVAGEKRFATRQGLAFAAQRTYPPAEVWHGYPESRDKVPETLRNAWLREGRIRRRDLRRWWTAEAVHLAWMEVWDGE